jgi:DNA (cytosine-5)-methyltransferase 1
MRYLSTFSGIGGFDLGFDRAGMTCVGQVEIDQKASAILARHWPDVPKHGDITTAREWASDNGLVGAVDLLCGGFPCQPFSIAGRREGREDPRGNLFWNALALATHVQARWIVLENVPGLLSSNSGRDFGSIITSLADAGYGYLEWRVLNSQFYGVPQRRRRLFVVAGTADPRRPPVLVEPEGGSRDSAAVEQARSEPADRAGDGTQIGGWSAGGVTTAMCSKWAKGSSGPAGDEHHNLVVVQECVWAGSAAHADIAAPLGALTGGPRTTDIENATWVVTS